MFKDQILSSKLYVNDLIVLIKTESKIDYLIFFQILLILIIIEYLCKSKNLSDVFLSIISLKRLYYL